MENSSLVDSLTSAVKLHSRAFGVAGAVIGAILVIYYCGSINYYPSGLSVADTLFFLWVVVVFGFYYSVIAFAFFIASIFWISIFAKPINFIIKSTKAKTDVVVPFPKSDWLIVLGGGLFANLLIFGISYSQDHSLLAIFSALFISGLLYTLIDNLSKRSSSSEKLLDSCGKPLKTTPKIVNNVLYVLIYAAPLLFSQVGGGVTRTTFETMGVRQIGVTLNIEVKEYEDILEGYVSEGFISDLSCNKVCTIKSANILFTSIGTNTKLELSGNNGKLLIVLPTKAIKLVASPIPNESNNSDAASSADS